MQSTQSMRAVDARRICTNGLPAIRSTLVCSRCLYVLHECCIWYVVADVVVKCPYLRIRVDSIDKILSLRGHPRPGTSGPMGRGPGKPRRVRHISHDRARCIDVVELYRSTGHLRSKIFPAKSVAAQNHRTLIDCRYDSM